MQPALLHFLFLVLASVVSAGPIHMKHHVIRHANEAQKRYVINELLTVTKGSPKKRQAFTQTVTGIDPFVTPTRKGTEDGSVPAVGVGGDNTSLLSLLTISPTQSSTTDGSAAGETSAAGANTSSDTNAAPGTGTAIKPNTAQTEVQPQATLTTTVQVQTTILETFTVTAEATVSATDGATQGAAPSVATPADGDQVEQPSATVTVVFVTAEPTFTGPTAGFTTLSPSPDTGGTAATTLPIATTGPNLDPNAASSNSEPSSTIAAARTSTEGVAFTSESSRESANTSTPGEPRPTTLSTASPFPDPETGPATVTAASSTTAADVAVVPVTPSPSQGQVTVTETETVTTTVTAR
ncbi:hypothetical protein A1O3_02781 [Capronia epimyces CBS 606.96]|uniref:Uncharacterized protein n=1 Tax=Capronia epimyces CBS 606.96 TaxID=1182542 RepID=W9Z5D5_9EURO|nr:uncharacterized protein A1O3_02781 [Capronia epimyces CBS 606.96]EXJ89714.1 hypothetical protein A1O3_02781 [Capronia epimyces CBS 606.96]